MVIKSDKIQYSKLGITRSVYDTVEKIIKTNPISELEIKTSNKNMIVSAKVLTNNTQYKSVINIAHDGYVSNFKCNCESSFVWKGACVHTTALFLHCIQKEQLIDTERQSVEAAKKIARHFEKTTISEIDDEIKADSVLDDEKIHITPVFCVDNDNLSYITLTLGKKRMYVVKNIKDFIENVKNKQDYSYGKDLRFNHSISSFDDESARFIEFIRAYYDMNETVKARNAMPRYYHRNDDAGGKSLYIYKKGLDEFFSLFENKSIAFNIANDKGTILFVSREPDLKMRIEGSIEKIELTCGVHSMRKLEGDKYDYLLINNELFRVDKKYTAVIWPLLGELFKTPGIKLIFAGKEATSFLTYILPHLKKHGMTKELDLLTENMEIYDLVKKLYIDMGENSVLCKPIFCYGDKEFLYTKKMGYNDGFRDVAGEYRIKHILKSMGFKAGSNSDVLELEDDDLIYDFCCHGVEQLKNEAEIYVSDGFKKKVFKPANKTKFGVKIKGELLEVSLETTDYGISELMEIIRSYNYKKRYHKLKDGRFVDLNDDSIQAASQMMSGLNITEKEIEGGTAVLPKYRALYLDGIASAGDNTFEINRDKAFRRLTNDFKNYRDLEFDIPETLDDILRPYQKIGFNWLKVLAHYGFGGILADDMGLGKTVQVISVLLSEKAGENAPSMVVAPTSLIYNWESEINKFAPSLTTEVISGLPAKRKEVIDLIGTGTGVADVYITTYDTLKRDIENYEGKRFRYVIADEAQNIKNPLTQNARAIKLLQSDIKYALTGTPIENSLSELWSIFDFIMPGYLFSNSKFSKHYETPIVKNDNEDRAGELRKQIAPFILRRIKKDVLKELPEKIETILAAEMTDEQKKIYTAHMLQARGELDGYISEGFSKNQIKIIALLTRLRQICCHPSLFIEGYEGGSGKLDLTMETIISAIGANHRIILFSQFTSMLAIIKEALEKEDIKYFYLDGQTPSRERLDMCERFNGGENELFLISLKAGGTGLNLTGADIVIHYDPWWNPAVMDQASDRAHRFGQKNMVQVINMVAKDSLEEKIMLLQQKKKDLVDAVIQEGTSFINKMTIDEVKDLFTESGE